MIQAPRGTKDILPDEIIRWQFAENVFRNVTKKFGYDELRTPIFESTEVFSRSIGDNTDIVNKEMYTFLDKGDTSITLRPEMTASLVRAVIQNNLTNRDTLQRLWYFGPFFRYERPQKGRFRQFHQFGAECLSTSNPEADIEVLLLAKNIIKELGLKDFKLNINSIGNKNVRENYTKDLVKYLESNKENLSEESKFRLIKNPLRILDSKYENDIKIVENSPQIFDFFDNESNEHFNYVKSKLNELEINFEINSKLVRGLDYYSHTVFEFQSNALGSQDAFGGGGRYNTLFEQLGGKNTPSVGFAFGVERLLLMLEAENQQIEKDNMDFYIAIMNVDYQSYLFEIANELRKNNFMVTYDLQRKSFKSQLKEANKINAKYLIIIGEEEYNSKGFNLKNMSNSQQQFYKIEDINSIMDKI